MPDDKPRCSASAGWCGNCLRCRVARQSARAGVAPPPPPPRCPHLGEPTGRTVTCRHSGKTQLPVLACAVKGECVTGDRAPAAADVAACRWCELNPANRPKRPAPLIGVYPLAGTPVGRKHLAYHVLPVRGRWRAHAERLRQAWGLFDGRKVVAVATGGEVKQQETGDPLVLEPVEAVRAELPPDAEVFEVENDPARWEAASWPGLWGRILTAADDADAVFYAHAKGTTRPRESSAHVWADLLYKACLGDWPAVENALRRHPIAGPMKRVGPFFAAARPGVPGMDRSEWHYSGNFWWARCGELKARLAAVPVPADPWGSEAWPGSAFRPHEAGDLWTPTGPFDPYSPADMGRVAAAFAGRVARADYPRLSVIIPTTGRATIERTIASIHPQLRHGDEVLIQRDETGDVGATPRTRGIQAATGDYLLWMDDDDVYLPGAFDAVRAGIRANPGRPLLFGMRRGEPFNDVLPAERAVKVGQVSTQMFAAPNVPGKLGTWTPWRTGDFDFISSTLANYPDGPVWVDTPIAVWRPSPEA